MVFKSLIFSFLLSFGLLYPFSLSAEEVSLNVSQHGTYARLHFIWPKEIFYKATLNKNQLEVTFAEPLNADVTFFANELPSYIKEVKTDNDGHKISFILSKDNFSLRDYKNKGNIFIDLIGKGDGTVKAEPIKSAPSKIEMTKENLPAITETTPLSPKNDIKEQKSDKIDVKNTAKNNDKLQNTPKPEIKNKPKEKIEKNKKTEVAAPTLVPPPSEQVIPPTIPSAITESEISSLNDTKTKDIPLADTITTDNGATETKNNPKTEETELPTSVANTSEQTQTIPPTIPVDSTESETSSLNEIKTDNNVAEETDSNFVPKITNTKQTTSSLNKPYITLSFPQRNIVPTAVFKRNGYLWVIFNSTEPLDLGLLRRLGGKAIKEIVQFPSQSATIVRILMSPDLNPTIRREGTLLILDISPEETIPNFALDVRPQFYSGLNTRLFIPVTGAAKPITLKDPSIGDTFQVVPVIPLGRGIETTRVYPEAELLKTFQGVVLVPKADMTEARTSNSGIEIVRRNKDFLLSKVDKKPTIRNDYTDALGIKDWGYVEAKDFVKEREKIQVLPLLVQKDRKDLAKMELARFMFANQQIPEALGILHVIEATSPDVAESRAFKALSGVSNFMMYRFKEADEYLSSPLLDGDEEVSLWRALTKVFTGNPGEQISTIKANLGFLRDYPNWLKNKLGFVALDAAVATEDDLAIQNFLEFVDNEETNSYQLAGIEYYRGKLNELTSAYGPAIAHYRNAENGRSRYYDAIAGLARIKLQMSIAELSSKDAAEELEHHRFAWREDGYEIEVLSKLVDIYLENKEFGKAMRIMKELSVFFEETEAGKNNAQRLKDTFIALCLDHKTDDISPIKLIALFEEFKELVPKNKTGNEIIRRLVDRMVAVDLLPRATELLETQMNNPLISNKEKVLVGTRLALINLLTKEPKKALEALDNSDLDTIEEPLKSRRLYIRVKTLALLGQIEEALALIGKDSSKEAMALKTEILWGEKRWAEVAETIRRTINKPAPQRAFTDEEARTIMYWITAMKLAGEDSSVAIARKNFMPYMQGTQYFNSFNLISSDKPVGIMDYKTVNTEIKTVENFRNFLKEYSEKLQQNSLSDIIK